MTNFFSTDRIRVSTRSFENPFVAFESDRGRIVFSAPLRRMQKKAQVFPLESNASVRSRLTHSLEVAHIGRYIATEIIEETTKLNKLQAEKKVEFDSILENQQSLISIVENACLLHDIGNPPFGHFGEAAIQDWFKSKGKEAAYKATNTGLSSEYFTTSYLDFVHFDGNPQGLRVITCLQGEDGKSGLNLTLAQLGAYLKYVGDPTKICSEKRLYKKAGYFSTERTVYQKLQSTFNLQDGARYPLAYLMEAADDLAYCLSDIEDGIEKKVVKFHEFREYVLKKLTSQITHEELNEVEHLLDHSTNKYVTESVDFRTKMLNKMVPEIAKQFVKNISFYFSGAPINEELELIEKKSLTYKVLNLTREFVAENVYQSTEAEHVELAGYSVVNGLLEHFSALLILSQDDFNLLFTDRKSAKKKGLDRELRLKNMISRNALIAYDAAKSNFEDNVLNEWHYRAHMIVDYISGMTDDFALAQFRLLAGIKISTE